jgi:hypothetical protein
LIRTLARFIASTVRGSDDARRPDARQAIAPDIARYLSRSYPHNHTYKISGHGRLRPRWELRRRSGPILSLYPDPLVSLLDLSCSKGYFVLEAGQRSTCERAMGIDVFGRDVDACREVQRHTRSRNTAFEQITLGETADRIDDFGGPFQTALLINSYQYLYFGSTRGGGYLDHGAIFEHLHRVCSESVIFSNRTELADCQNRAEIAAVDPARAADYHNGAILAAAARYFTLLPAANLGRYPLWRLVKR